jgi:hypothetical protein
MAAIAVTGGGGWLLRDTERGDGMPLKSEREIAIELVKLLDGVPISKARNALEHAIILLSEYSNRLGPKALCSGSSRGPIKLVKAQFRKW